MIILRLPLLLHTDGSRVHFDDETQNISAGGCKRYKAAVEGRVFPNAFSPPDRLRQNDSIRKGDRRMCAAG